MSQVMAVCVGDVQGTWNPRTIPWSVTWFSRGESSVQFSSVAQSCLTLCDPMDCSTSDLPVHHQLLEFTQTHVHWVSDAIQPSHSLLSPCPPALNLPQHQGLFKRVSSSHEMAKVLEFQRQHHSFQWVFRTVANNSVQLRTKLYVVVVCIWKIQWTLKLHKNTLCFLWEKGKFPQPYHSNIRVFIFPCFCIL